jgi:hypothetical protein
MLIMNHPVRDLAIGALHILRKSDVLFDVEHDSDKCKIVFARSGYETAPCVHLDIGCINDRQFPTFQALFDDIVQEVEGRAGRSLVRFIVTDEAAAIVTGNYLEGQEVLSRKSRLSRARDPDEEH